LLRGSRAWGAYKSRGLIGALDNQISFCFDLNGELLSFGLRVYGSRLSDPTSNKLRDSRAWGAYKSRGLIGALDNQISFCFDLNGELLSFGLRVYGLRLFSFRSPRINLGVRELGEPINHMA